MRATVLAVLFGFLFAGCLGSATKSLDTGHDASGGSVSTPRIQLPDVIRFAQPLVLGTLQGGTEPSIATGPDGVVFVTTPQSPGAAIWRSDDGGKSFKPLGTPMCPAVGTRLPTCPGLQQYASGARGGGDADIRVAPNGRVHWLGLADGANATPYQYSDDRGETWSQVVDLADNETKNMTADREWITTRADGTLFAVWRNFPPANSGVKAKIVLRVSEDNGTTWSPIHEIANDTRQGGIAVDPSSDALALAYDVGGKVSVAHSFDNGTTWESVRVLDDPVLGHVFPVTAFDAAGNLYLAVAHDRDGAPVPRECVQLPTGATQCTPVDPRPFETPNLYLLVSKDKGLTWSDPVQVNAPGTTVWFPWLAAGAEGRVVLVWYQNDRGLPRQAMDAVYVMSGISVDADQPAPKFALNRISDEPVHRGPECRENGGPVLCSRSLLDFFEVAIHPDGYPVVAFSQDTYPVPRVSVATSYMSEGPDLLH